MNLAYLADLATAAVAVLLFGLAFAQVCRPWPARPAGVVQRRIRLPLRARVRLHGVWLLGAALLLLGAASLGVLVSPWPFVAATVAAAALLACPVRYTLTDQGIAVSRTSPRRWTEFGGISARNGWVYLQPVTGCRGLLIRTPDPAQTEELAAELRRLVRGAYKGQVGPYRGTVDSSAALGDESEASGVGAAA